MQTKTFLQFVAPYILWYIVLSVGLFERAINDPELSLTPFWTLFNATIIYTNVIITIAALIHIMIIKLRK